MYTDLRAIPCMIRARYSKQRCTYLPNHCKCGVIQRVQDFMVTKQAINQVQGTLVRQSRRFELFTVQQLHTVQYSTVVAICNGEQKLQHDLKNGLQPLVSIRVIVWCWVQIGGGDIDGGFERFTTGNGGKDGTYSTLMTRVHSIAAIGTVHLALQTMIVRSQFEVDSVRFR